MILFSKESVEHHCSHGSVESPLLIGMGKPRPHGWSNSVPLP